MYMLRIITLFLILPQTWTHEGDISLKDTATIQPVTEWIAPSSIQERISEGAAESGREDIAFDEDIPIRTRTRNTKRRRRKRPRRPLPPTDYDIAGGNGASGVFRDKTARPRYRTRPRYEAPEGGFSNAGEGEIRPRRLRPGRRRKPYRFEELPEGAVLSPVFSEEEHIPVRRRPGYHIRNNYEESINEQPALKDSNNGEEIYQGFNNNLTKALLETFDIPAYESEVIDIRKPEEVNTLVVKAETNEAKIVSGNNQSQEKNQQEFEDIKNLNIESYPQLEQKLQANVTQYTDKQEQIQTKVISKENILKVQDQEKYTNKNIHDHQESFETDTTSAKSNNLKPLTKDVGKLDQRNSLAKSTPNTDAAQQNKSTHDTELTDQRNYIQLNSSLPNEEHVENKSIPIKTNQTVLTRPPVGLIHRPSLQRKPFSARFLESTNKLNQQDRNQKKSNEHMPVPVSIEELLKMRNMTFEDIIKENKNDFNVGNSENQTKSENSTHLRPGLRRPPPPSELFSRKLSAKLSQKTRRPTSGIPRNILFEVKENTTIKYAAGGRDVNNTFETTPRTIKLTTNSTTPAFVTMSSTIQSSTPIISISTTVSSTSSQATVPSDSSTLFTVPKITSFSTTIPSTSSISTVLTTVPSTAETTRRISITTVNSSVYETNSVYVTTNKPSSEKVNNLSRLLGNISNTTSTLTLHVQESSELDPINTVDKDKQFSSEHQPPKSRAKLMNYVESITDRTTITTEQQNTNNQLSHIHQPENAENVPKIRLQTPRDEIVELLRTESGSVRLARILAIRNMTLRELIEHRERGSSQQHLSEMFGDSSTRDSYLENLEQLLNKFKDSIKLEGNLQNEKYKQNENYYSDERTQQNSNDNTRNRQGQQVLTIAIPPNLNVENKTKYDIVPPLIYNTHYQISTINYNPDTSLNDYVSHTSSERNFPSINRQTEEPKSMVDHTGKVLEIDEEDDNDIAYHSVDADNEIEGNEHVVGIPKAVKSAIIASSIILGMAIFVFFAIFITCKLRQRNARRRYARTRNPILCDQGIPELACQSKRGRSPMVMNQNDQYKNDRSLDSEPVRYMEPRRYYLWRTIRKTLRYK